MNRAPTILAPLPAAQAKTSAARFTACATDVARKLSTPAPDPDFSPHTGSCPTS